MLVAAGGLGLLLAYWTVLFTVQRNLLFPGGISEPGLTRPRDAEQIWLQTSAGRVEAWFLPPLADAARGGRSPLLLYAHGNGELIDYWPAAFTEPRHFGLGVLLVEFPGYGRSQGRASEASIREAMLAAFEWVRGRPDLDPERVVAHGRSLGGGAACLLAASRPVRALILESTFTSVRSFASKFGAPGFLVRDPFDNLAVVRRFEGPLLVLHGERDQLIPTEHGRALAAAGRHAELELLPCGHNDCDPAWSRVHKFLAEQRVLP
jgi:fermentation-respiration switch protein FrsA (DUF1100 family)